MNDEPLYDESLNALDRAIRAVMAEPVPEEVRNRVTQTALGFAGGEPNVPRNHFLERMLNMVQTRPRLSVATAMTVVALAAGLTQFLFLVSPAGQAYALEETAQANNHVTSYHVKITPAVLGEAWVQLNPDGTPNRARIDYQTPFDGAKVVILSNGKAEVWFKSKNSLLFSPSADALKRISEMRDLADPKLAFERLQAEKAAGKVEIATRQPGKDGGPIVLTVTSRINPDLRQVYEVNPRDKLVEQITDYRRTGHEWEQVKLCEYLDYNQPIDPKVFQPEIPKDVIVLDWLARKPGLVRGDLTEDEIARKVVREFFEALIARDYDKAGLINEAIQGEKLKERFGKVKFLRIIEIGKPAPDRWCPWTKALLVPVKVEIEIQGRREVRDFSPGVRQEHPWPDRRVISGGI